MGKLKDDYDARKKQAEDSTEANKVKQNQEEQKKKENALKYIAVLNEIVYPAYNEIMNDINQIQRPQTSSVIIDTPFQVDQILGTESRYVDRILQIFIEGNKYNIYVKKLEMLGCFEMYYKIRQETRKMEFYKFENVKHDSIVYTITEYFNGWI